MIGHQQAVKDFDLQIEMNEFETYLLHNGNEVMPYGDEVMPSNEAEAEDLKQKKLKLLEQKKFKLLSGKRYHQNSANAYWYYLAKAGK
jgi:hypothetical protein